MTIAKDERARMVERSQPAPAPESFHRSGLVSSLVGMLAGLGMLTLISATLAATLALLSLQFELEATDAELRGLVTIAVAIIAVVVLASTVVGGFVAGRFARYGGIKVGVGASLWLMLVLGIFIGLGVGLGEASGTFDRVEAADRLTSAGPVDLIVGAAVAGGVLVVLALLGGLMGGRFGQTAEPGKTEAVVDLRESDNEEPLVEDDETSV